RVPDGAQEPGSAARPGPRRRGRARSRPGGAAAPLGTAGAGDGRAEGVRAVRPAVRAAAGAGDELPAHARQPPAALGAAGAGAGPVRLPLAPLPVAGGASGRGNPKDGGGDGRRQGAGVRGRLTAVAFGSSFPVPFDLGFLTRMGFTPTAPVLCTQNASRVLYAGQKVGHSLKECARRELGIDLPKEQQRSDWSGTLRPEQLEYAGKDVLFLGRLQAALGETIAAAGLD